MLLYNHGLPMEGVSHGREIPEVSSTQQLLSAWQVTGLILRKTSLGMWIFMVSTCGGKMLQ